MDVKEYKEFLQTKCTTAWTDHCIFAAELVKLLEPEIIVDLGVDEGYSTFSFAAYNVGKVYGIDAFLGDPMVGLKQTYNKVNHISKEIKLKFGINNIDFIQGLFDDVAKDWNKEIDILHIDGFHTLEAVENDYNKWSKFCHNNSIILFHDVLEHHESVGEFFMNTDGYKILRKQSSGLGILTVNKQLNDIIQEISSNYPE